MNPAWSTIESSTCKLQVAFDMTPVWKSASQVPKNISTLVRTQCQFMKICKEIDGQSKAIQDKQLSLSWRAKIQQEWLTLLTMLQCGEAWPDIYLSDMTASSKNRFCFTGSQRRSLNVGVLLIFMIKLPGSAVKFCTDCSLQIFLFQVFDHTVEEYCNLLRLRRLLLSPVVYDKEHV